MTIESAQRAITQGALAALISGILTLVIALFAIATNATGDLGFFNDPWQFFEVTTLFVCAFAVHRRSRFITLLLVLHSIFSQVILFQELGATGFSLGAVFLFFYWRASFATFIYHSRRRAEDPNYRAFRRWTLVFWIPAAALLLLLVAAGVWSMFAPPLDLVDGETLGAEHRQTLIENGVIEEDEEVILFYSAGVLSILEDGNLLTDRRVISYEKAKGNRETNSSAYSEVREARVIEKGDYFSDSLIEVVRLDGSAFYLFAPASHEDDERFLHELNQRISATSEQAGTRARK